MAIWEKNGHIIEDQNGHPIECAWCPCGDMTCDDIIAQQIAVCEQTGAYYLHQTGFLYSLTDPSAEVIPSIFHWIDWTYDSVRLIYVCHLKYLDCDCEKVTLATAEFAAPPATIDLFGYAFLPNSSACAGGCEEQIATLIAQAVASGWTLHGEGVMVRRNSTQNSCYLFHDSMSVYIVADTGSAFKYVACDCSTGEISSSYYSLYKYLEYSACDCIDERELILTYPEVFGVEDVSFGDDTVWATRSSATSAEWHSCGIFGQYCDYRTMYFIVDNVCVGRQYGTGDKTILRFQYDGRWDVNWRTSTYDIQFKGHVPPFSTQADNNARWTNFNFSWHGSTTTYADASGNEYDEGPFYSKADAEAWLANHPDVIKIPIDAWVSETTEPLSPVAFTLPTIIEGRVEYNDYEEMWYAYMPHYGGGVFYRIQIILTNKGYLVNGVDGFQECVLVKGWGALQDYGWVSVFQGNPPEDDTNECTDIEEDMGGCMDAEWWQAVIEDSEEEEEEDN